MAGKWIDVSGQHFYGWAFNQYPTEFPTKLPSTSQLREGATVYDVLRVATGQPTVIASNAGKVIRAVDATLRLVTEYTAEAVQGAAPRQMVNGFPHANFARAEFPCIFDVRARSDTYPPSVAQTHRAAANWDWNDPVQDQFSALWTGTARHDIVIPDTTVPIGLIGAQADLRVASGWGGGLITVAFQRTGGALGLFNKIRYFVSPKPTWRHVPPGRANFRTGDTDTIQVHAEYPDGEKVVGLRVRIATGAYNFDFRAAGSQDAYSRAATADTDSNGVARFEVRGVNTGLADYTITADTAYQRDLFAPAIQGSYPLRILAGRPVGTDCVVVPAQPHVPAVPSRIDVAPQYGWDSGANSITTRDGDVRLRFTMGRVVGVVVGITTDRDEVVQRSRLSHALYFYQQGGQALVRVVEGGQPRGDARSYVSGDEFRIERAGRAVTYYVADAVMYRSREESVGTLSVGSMLYATGDGIE